eukprot:1160897-Pelagomonas_calceolata.AAC.5
MPKRLPFIAVVAIHARNNASHLRCSAKISLARGTGHGRAANTVQVLQGFEELPEVQRDFEELPEAAVPQLRDSLLALLLKYAKGQCTIGFRRIPAVVLGSRVTCCATTATFLWYSWSKQALKKAPM